MLISKKHVEDFIDISDISDEVLEHQLSCYGGLEVEGVSDLIEDKGYVVGFVETMEKHENADKLNVCTVDLGNEKVQIVCGAPNVKEGAYVIVAPVGTVMPNGMKIDARELKGIESSGMICSLQEIGLDEKFVDARYKDGIYMFEDSIVEAGMNALEALEMNTEIIDLDITPNRPDCLSYRGVAYELGALFNRSINKNAIEKEQVLGELDTTTIIEKITFETPNVMQYYALPFTGIEVKPSPQWLQSFLVATGVRPINNIVDITNYVMLVTGLPMHAFDAKKLNGETEIIVRQAKEDEAFITLDGQERMLNTQDVVISTSKEPIAIAGVMGGENSKVDDATTEILLEAAIFDPVSVRKTSIAYDLRSDASIRFEKGVDQTLPPIAMALATELLINYANATVGDTIVATMKDQEKTMNSIESMLAKVQEKLENTITFSHHAVENEIGVKLTEKEVVDILERLQFKVVALNKQYVVTPPSFRTQITMFEEVIDEIVRLYGYENIPNTLPEDIGRPVFVESDELEIEAIREKLQASGLNEILTYTLTSKEKAVYGVENGEEILLEIPHPLNKERKSLKLSNITSMLETMMYHKNRNIAGIAFYEFTTVYMKDKNKEILSLGAYGMLKEQKLYENTESVDFYKMKYWVELVLEQFNIITVQYKPSENTIYHPGKSADIYIDEEFVGSFGELHPLEVKKLDVADGFYLAELDMDVLLQEKFRKTIAYNKVSKMPTIERDLAFVIKREITAEAITSVIKTHAGENCTDVAIFDVYTGSHVAKDEKSIAIKVSYNNPSKTLTSDEIDQSVENIKVALSEIGATLRA